MRQNLFDAIVVGSGITGGWAAKELTEKGLRTLVLERGRNVEHGAGYVTEHLPDHAFPFRGLGDRRREQREQPIQRTGGSYHEASARFYVDDRLNPYTHDVDKPFSWIRGHQLGGRSLTWYRQCYRWSDLDFTANSREGIAVDWPIRYADIAPWYDHVERFVGISGKAEGLAQLPDGIFLPPMPMNVAELRVADAIAKSFPDRRLTASRTATLTRDHNGRSACHFCGPCERGCSTGSYFSSLSATLPAARATGRLTIRTDAIVHSIIYDPRRRRVAGVRVIDAHTRATSEYRTRVVFLCASALESVRLLLNSATPEFGTGLANSSGTLGTHIMDHHWGGGASATFPDLPTEPGYSNGFRPCGVIVPRFRNLRAADQPFLRGYHLDGGGSRVGWKRGIAQVGLGADLKSVLKEMGPWTFWLSGNGECLPYADNCVRLNREVKDAWGVPVLHFAVSYRENETRMRADMAVCAGEMLEAAGAKDIKVFNEPDVPGLVIHEMGGARMGRDPATSVLNAYNQAHDLPNLFVTDGACMTSGGNQNPSITYMALTARACDHAVNELKRNNL
ncbi:MAG TPA: GMC family oxidoreductase [Steroidobacteraceae bacterium]|jgi:choline dehydrogenase-like flavoprotein|nr:GMC family oxidoreductase [Steroidobacteraceae bacterium]